MIPKIIHQIWIGDKKRPDEWINTWKEKNPDFEHLVWSEKELSELGFRNQKLFDYFYKKKIWFGVSDIVRIELVERFGGVYIDADMECLEPIEDLLAYDFWAVETNPIPGIKYRVSNSAIGAIPNHPILEEYIERMGKAKKIEPLWSTIGGTLFTEVIQEKKDGDDVVLPAHTFYPENSKKTIKYDGNGKVYARHYWGQTNKLYE